MSARAVQNLLVASLVIIAVVGVLLVMFGPSGYRRDLVGVYTASAYGLFGVTLLCAGAVWRERKLLALVQDEAKKRKRERRIARQVLLVYLGLAAAFPVGYWLGERI